MRGVFVLCILLVVFFKANSQQFGCGADAMIPGNWRAYLEKNLQPDSLLLDTVPAGCYTVKVSLVIDINGRITDVIIVKDPGHGLGGWIKTCIEAYKGKWKPAQINGRPVKSYHMQPVTILIEEEKEKKECDELVRGLQMTI